MQRNPLPALASSRYENCFDLNDSLNDFISIQQPFQAPLEAALPPQTLPTFLPQQQPLIGGCGVDGMAVISEIEEHEQKIVAEFCHLLDKSKVLFNGLRYCYILFTNCV